MSRLDGYRREALIDSFDQPRLSRSSRALSDTYRRRLLDIERLVDEAIRFETKTSIAGSASSATCSASWTPIRLALSVGRAYAAPRAP